MLTMWAGVNHFLRQVDKKFIEMTTHDIYNHFITC